jgi:hypothetical protein
VDWSVDAGGAGQGRCSHRGCGAVLIAAGPMGATSGRWGNFFDAADTKRVLASVSPCRSLVTGDVASGPHSASAGL